MKELSINLLKLLFIWTIAVFLVASCGRSAYASSVHQKADELALVGYNNEGVQSAYRTFFVRNLYASACYGGAGEGHLRVCWFPSLPVDQPFLVLPPSFGREWQDSYK